MLSLALFLWANWTGNWERNYKKHVYGFLEHFRARDDVITPKRKKFNLTFFIITELFLWK